MARKSKASKARVNEDENNATNSPQVAEEGNASENPQRNNPFGEIQAGWVFERAEMKHIYHRVIVKGKETLIGDIRRKLDKLGVDLLVELKKSVHGYFMELGDNLTRSGTAIHYMVSRQLKATNPPDKTSLWFMVNGTVLRFSRVEFALVSGLRFGTSDFDPYAAHALPENSLYERVFDRAPITPLDLLKRFIARTLDGAQPEDYVKIAKMLLACHYVLGYDPNKYKISDWLWVLLEDKDEWDKFPWGSMSFQILTQAITDVRTTPCENKSGPSYHLKGNTTAFLAWIFCAIPDAGEKIGCRTLRDRRPRLLTFTYAKMGDDVEIDDEKVVPFLEPDSKEIKRRYWRSLANDPESMPFSFKYDANEKRRKQPLLDNGGNDGGDEDGDNADIDAAGLSNASRAARRVATAMSTMSASERAELVKEIGDYAGNVAAKRARIEMEAILQIQRENIVNDLLQKLVEINQQNLRSVSPLQPVSPGSAQLVQTPPPTAPATQAPPAAATEAPPAAEAANPQTGSVSAAATLHPVEFEQILDIAAAATKDALQLSENEADDPVPSDAVKHDPKVTSTDVVQENAESVQVPTQQPSDTQLNDVYDTTMMVLEYVTPATQVLPIVASEQSEPQVLPQQALPPLNPRPIRIRFPAAICRSPFLIDDVRPARDTFDNFINSNIKRNVGLPWAVNAEYFNQIIIETEQLLNDHIDAYLGVLETSPSFASVENVDPRIVIAPTFFQDAIDNAFDAVHQEKRVGVDPYKQDLFDPATEEVILEKELIPLCKIAEGVTPQWGHKKWIDCDKVVTIANISEHWVTLLLKLKEQKLVLYDSTAFKFEEHHKANRREAFLPLARVLPQVLKSVGYFEHNGIPNPTYTQWELCFPKAKGKGTFKQNDNINCGLYALRYVETIISNNVLSFNLNNKKGRKQYREHIARTIYANSTNEDTVPIEFNLDNV